MGFVLQTQMATEAAHQPPAGDTSGAAANASSEEEDEEVEEEERATRNEVGKMLKAAVKELESALQVTTVIRSVLSLLHSETKIII